MIRLGVNQSFQHPLSVGGINFIFRRRFELIKNYNLPNTAKSITDTIEARQSSVVSRAP